MPYTLDNLTDVVLNGDHGGLGREKVAAVLDQLGRNTTVKTLTICNHYPTDVTDTFIKSLCEAARENRSVQKVNLLNNFGIGSEGFAALADMMESNSAIVELLLDKDKNQSYSTELQQRIKAATMRNYDAHVLELEEVSIDSRFGDEHAAALAEPLGKGLPLTTSVRSLHLKSKALGDEQLVALAGGLKTNKTVEKLSLDGTGSGRVGLMALANMLASNQSLKILFMHRTPIEEDVAAAIATALKDNNTLERLFIRYSSLSTEAVRQLATILRDNSSLIEFDLSENTMECQAVKAIADGLAVNSTLLKMALWQCKVGEKGLEFLEEAMQSNDTLLFLQTYNPYAWGGRRPKNWERCTSCEAGTKKIWGKLKRNNKGRVPSREVLAPSKSRSPPKEVSGPSKKRPAAASGAMQKKLAKATA